MKVPASLTPLVEGGVIERVIRPLKSGKEAQVYLVEARGQVRVAKVYKEAESRSFRQRAQYTEGRRTRNSRDQRAMARRSGYGRAQDEAAWRSTEADVIERLFHAGVRVPTPYDFVEGVLVMELIAGADGGPAPRLSEVALGPEEGERLFGLLIAEVVKMLCADIVHGDLSPYNVLLVDETPVVIDFPQAVDASANQNARDLLLRDVRNLTEHLLAHQRGHRKLKYGQEMWALYERGDLTPGVQLTGRYKAPKIDVSTQSILDEIAYFEAQERKKREALGLPMRAARKPADDDDALEVMPGSDDWDEPDEAPAPRARRRQRRGSQGGDGSPPRDARGARGRKPADAPRGQGGQGGQRGQGGQGGRKPADAPRGQGGKGGQGGRKPADAPRDQGSAAQDRRPGGGKRDEASADDQPPRRRRRRGKKS